MFLHILSNKDLNKFLRIKKSTIKNMENRTQIPNKKVNKKKISLMISIPYLTLNLIKK
jgi:ribosome-binding protein aMBF1 (putative translation factor)